MLVLLLPPPPPPTTTTATLVTPVGATQLYVPGIVYAAHVACAAVILLDAALQAPAPAALAALTLKVYAVPRVRPVTVNGEDAPDVVMPPGVDVAV
jgi:hypothetical protein